jgi:hypothetical protein
MPNKKGSGTFAANERVSCSSASRHRAPPPWRIEKELYVSKHDLQARPIYHHKRESIQAHLAVVFAPLIVTREIETRSDWPIERSAQTARSYRTNGIGAGGHVLSALEPLPAHLRNALAVIT